jgi:hypothetical protein
LAASGDGWLRSKRTPVTKAKAACYERIERDDHAAPEAENSENFTCIHPLPLTTFLLIQAQQRHSLSDKLVSFEQEGAQFLELIFCLALSAPQAGRTGGSHGL